MIVTTPNVEYNVRFETLPAGKLRHKDHRFEWTRAEFQNWAGGSQGDSGIQCVCPGGRRRSGFGTRPSALRSSPIGSRLNATFAEAGSPLVRRRTERSFEAASGLEFG